MTINEVYPYYQQQLSAQYTSAEIRWFGTIALQFVLNYSKVQLTMNPQQVLSTAQWQQLEQLQQRLQQSEPIQYITGEAYFYDLCITVNPSVLIPRPETEELVDWVLNDYQTHQNELRILDIGTGSGCIAISLQKHLPKAKVSALDISTAALAVTQKNAQKYQLPLQTIQANILDLRQWQKCEKYDVIVSNPPYIPLEEQVLMAKNVLEYEPALALFVANNEPLVFYAAIAKFAQKHLRPNGCVYVEINEHFGEATQKLFSEMGFATTVLRQDMQGKDRMLKAKIRTSIIT